VYEITWWAPPSIIHLVPAVPADPADPVGEIGEIGRAKPTIFGRLFQRVSAAWQRIRS
jgi:hypothetical protein